MATYDFRATNGQFVKGVIPWNKGVATGISPSNKKEPIKLSCKQCEIEFTVKPYRKNTAKFCSRSCAAKWQMTGERHHQWKGGKPKCLKCDTFLGHYESNYCNEHKFTKEAKKKMSQKAKDNNSKYWLNKKRPEISGENNWNWKGGKYTENYRERRRFQRVLQKRVFERDNYTCQICNKKGDTLHVDHIQPFAEYLEGRFDLSNCRTLCVSCHYFVTFKKPMPINSRWGFVFKKGGY